MSEGTYHRYKFPTVSVDPCETGKQTKPSYQFSESSSRRGILDNIHVYISSFICDKRTIIVSYVSPNAINYTAIANVRMSESYNSLLLSTTMLSQFASITIEEQRLNICSIIQHIKL